MKRHIPKTKFDLQAVGYLKLSSFDEIRSDVPELLEWIQDGNWPVARGIREYLTPHVNEIKDELLFILNTNDDTWKCYLLYGLIGMSKDKLDEELVLKIMEIAASPTVGEVEDGVDEAAKDIIKKSNWSIGN